jgi:hypothetical protein
LRPPSESSKDEARAARGGSYLQKRAPGQSAPKPKGPVLETLSHPGALVLAKQLEKYWHDKGYPAARFWAEPIGKRFEKIGSYELYRVASNLVNGLPPRYLDQADVK